MSARRYLVVVLGLLLCSEAAPSGAPQQPVRAALQPPSSRQPAPAFSLRDASGTTRPLSHFLGKTVVLNLWATECGGCKAELPTFVDLHRAHAGEGLRVIGVSLDVMYEDLKSTADGWARVRPFARAHGLRYTIMVDDGSVEKAYNVTAMPATYLIDKRGRIAATYVGVVEAADLKTNVKTLLAEPF